MSLASLVRNGKSPIVACTRLQFIAFVKNTQGITVFHDARIPDKMPIFITHRYSIVHLRCTLSATVHLPTEARVHHIHPNGLSVVFNSHITYLHVVARYEEQQNQKQDCRADSFSEPKVISVIVHLLAFDIISFTSMRCQRS